MKTSVLIRNARLTDGSAPADLLVSGGVITTKAPAGTLLESAAEKALDASGKLVLPGLFDIHAHLCQPGREDKERVATATAARPAWRSDRTDGDAGYRTRDGQCRPDYHVHGNMPDGCSGGGYPLRLPDQGGRRGRAGLLRLPARQGRPFHHGRGPCARTTCCCCTAPCSTPAI